MTTFTAPMRATWFSEQEDFDNYDEFNDQEEDRDELAADDDSDRGPDAPPSTSNDVESRVLLGLLDGVAELPHGSDRSKQCSIRRSEIREGLEQIEQTLEEAKRKIAQLAWEPLSAGRSELELLVDRLECAIGMALGLERGERVLEALQSSPEHGTIIQDILDVQARAMDVKGLLSVHLNFAPKPVVTPRRNSGWNNKVFEDPFAYVDSLVQDFLRPWVYG